MNPVLHIQSSSSEPPKLDSEDLQLRVDFFRKLGYSSADVEAALRKLGLGTDTNSVLGELVQSRITTLPCNSEGDEKSTGPKDPLLPPSWVQGPSRMTPQLGDRKNADMELRPIVIDGSNVAISHGNKEVFSCRGIQLAVNFFLDRGHSAITVFVPTWRKEQPRPDAPITDQHILMELEKRKIVVFTPSRRVGGKRVVCYDDRFIVKLAHESEGVIVSNDTYRDLQGERPEWKKCIEERLLMYSFVNDKFMPPDDPLGRHGPSLDNFLRKKPLPTEQKRQLCPYDKKCTYGIKCKFYHPERANQSYRSLADELREKAQISTGKEEKGSKLQSGPYQSDPGLARSACSHPEDSKTEYFKEQGFSHPGQVSENTLLYWDDSRNSPVPVPCPVTGNSYQKEWPGLSSAHSYYYTNLDSGFGSYENHYSDYSPYLNNSHMLLPQQPSAFSGSRHVAAQVEKNNGSEPCKCCSQVLPRTTQQNHRSLDSKDQPKYGTYPPHIIPPLQNSHPCYGEAPNHPKYWSDPFQGLPLARMTRCLPSPADTSHNSSCSYSGHQYLPWGQQQQQSSSAAFDPKRSELRKKLQAIFNPQQVDTVMEMFPRLMDAEKLAAEILNLKAQRGVF